MLVEVISPNKSRMLSLYPYLRICLAANVANRYQREILPSKRKSKQKRQLLWWTKKLCKSYLSQLTTQQKTVCMISTIVMVIFVAKQLAYGSSFSTNRSSLKKGEGNISLVSAPTKSLYTAEDQQKINDVFYKTNQFGDVFPIWQSIPEEKLKEKLLNFAEPFKETRRAIILEIPHEKSAILDIVRQAHFTFHYGDQDQTTWVIKNLSSLPAPFTAVSGAHVIILKDDQVLVIEERTRKGILGFPAGGSDPGEFARETACRELHEEVGLSVQSENLKLIALINRKKANKQGANLIGHCFLAQKFIGELKIDPIEIVQAFWISLQALAEASEINSLKVPPYLNELAKHILNGCQSSYSCKLPDHRQTLMIVDPTDTMNVEFIHQDL